MSIEVIGGVVVVVGTGLLLNYLEGSAAMRGTRGEDSIPQLGKRALRAAFLLLLLSPLYLLDLLPPLLLLLLYLLYLPSYSDLSELHGGRPSAWMKGWRFWKYVQNYFPLSLVRSGELDQKDKYIFAMHPHGILPFGGMTSVLSDCSGASEVFDKIEIRTLAASFCFYLPLYREILLGGGVTDASRYSASQLLKSGKSLVLVPGGATEALYADPKQDVLYLRSRKGFVKLAMTHGAKLVPIFSFNECNTYSQLSSEYTFVNSLKKKFQAIFGISLPLITNIFPHRVPITTVVGTPVDIPHLENPSDEEVQKALDLYIVALEKLYNDHKDKYNIPKDKTLKII